MINALFNKTFSVLDTTLDLRAARQKLLSSNIANIETPGYRAKDINFESELKAREGMGPGTPSAQLRLVSTSPVHIPAPAGINGEPLALDRASDYEGYDANSVGIEGEMARMTENSLMYNITTKMLRAKFNGLMTAIKEGGR